ncbi:MAG: High-affinity Fe2+/Pb2+ permease [Acidimicrobiaceae bacterium]|nr:High-affinity Fe2+/Pb2+ permease [Acidimicrobiaceae bacterium]
MIATFVIFLREGIEASMIVAILLAYLDRIGQRRHFRDVFLGVAAALVLAGGGGVAAYLTIRAYAGSRVQTIFETCTYILAAIVLTYMTFWMRSHSRSISSELRTRAEAAISRGERLGLALLAFQAVGREGIETAVFTLAIVFATGTHGTIVGGVAGLAIALVMAFVIYRLGRRINLGAFFIWIGAVLMVFAAGLVADTVENLQQLGWVRLFDHPLWNTSSWLSEGSALGDVFHSLFGYAQQPTPLQLGAYLVYLVGALGLFTTLHRRNRRAATKGVTTPAPAPAGDGVSSVHSAPSASQVGRA